MPWVSICSSLPIYLRLMVRIATLWCRRTRWHCSQFAAAITFIASSPFLALNTTWSTWSVKSRLCSNCPLDISWHVFSHLPSNTYSQLLVLWHYDSYEITTWHMLYLDWPMLLLHHTTCLCCRVLSEILRQAALVLCLDDKPKCHLRKILCLYVISSPGTVYVFEKHWRMNLS